MGLWPVCTRWLTAFSTGSSRFSWPLPDLCLAQESHVTLPFPTAKLNARAASKLQWTTGWPHWLTRARIAQLGEGKSPSMLLLIATSLINRSVLLQHFYPFVSIFECSDLLQQQVAVYELFSLNIGRSTVSSYIISFLPTVTLLNKYSCSRKQKWVPKKKKLNAGHPSHFLPLLNSCGQS